MIRIGFVSMSSSKCNRGGGAEAQRKPRRSHFIQISLSAHFSAAPRLRGCIYFSIKDAATSARRRCVASSVFSFASFSPFSARSINFARS